MIDIFEQPSHPAVREKPDRRCTQEQFLIERMGLPPEWQAYQWEALGEPGNATGVRLSGGVFRHTIQRGPRKGRTDYGKPEPFSEVTATVSLVEYETWQRKWQNETGLCFECEGTGVVFAGWDHKKGTRHRGCGACGASGNAPAVAAEAAS